MTAPAPWPDTAGFRRDPDQVMRLTRLGAAHPMRLSFLRVLLRRMETEGWRLGRVLFDLDARGVGRAVYRVQGPARCYSLVVFAHDLPDAQRSDRVIATAWDATFALCDGTPGPADLDRLAANVPRQEAGRLSARELVLGRANRSVRLFAHVIGRLAAGAQPDPARLAQTGYLMRTTAVYGSGKFGAADRADLALRDELAAPFQAEMLAVWMLRVFTVDLVDHLARQAGGAQAVPLAPGLRRMLGVGNSTGLGMAPFLVRHPVLLNNWVMAREEALARVRAQPQALPGTPGALRAALAAARDNANRWHSDDPRQQARLADLRTGLERLGAHLDGTPDRGGWAPGGPLPWDRLWRWGAVHLPLEAQEALLALMLEPHGALVDGLACCLSDAGPAPGIDGAMTVGALRALIRQGYGWALRADHARPDRCARFWYVSADKLEPRLGERHSEPGAACELPLDIARRVAALAAALEGLPDRMPVARLALDAPQHRLALRRVQASAGRPFLEIRDTLLGADLLPVDMLRLKLAFFGATRFDPRSDRWVRISLFQGAPWPDLPDGPRA